MNPTTTGPESTKYCLVCAYERPAKITHEPTGVYVCVDCAGAATKAGQMCQVLEWHGPFTTTELLSLARQALREVVTTGKVGWLQQSALTELDKAVQEPSSRSRHIVHCPLCNGLLTHVPDNGRCVHCNEHIAASKCPCWQDDATDGNCPRCEGSGFII